MKIKYGIIFEIQQLETGMKIHKPIMGLCFMKQSGLTTKISGENIHIKQKIYKEISFESIIDHFQYDMKI